MLSQVNNCIILSLFDKENISSKNNAPELLKWITISAIEKIHTKIIILQLYYKEKLLWNKYRDILLLKLFEMLSPTNEMKLKPSVFPLKMYKKCVKNTQ